MGAGRRKNALEIAIDFFFGAAFADVVVALGFLRVSGRVFHWNMNVFWVCLFASTLIAGSLAALFRNQFWSQYETYSVIPPMEEGVSRTAKVVLWFIFAIGCASLGLLLVI